MAKVKISRPPSEYPPVAFHLIRLAQFLSSVIVSSILAYFIHFLLIETYAIPWTFILLFTVSLLTIVTYLITTIFYHQRTLKPRLSASINGFLTVLWMLGFGLLVWNLSQTLTHKCVILNWGSEAGVMVCRLYKALTAFTVTGTLSSVLSLLLDVRVNRKIASRGTYNPMQDIKPARNGASDVLHESYGEASLEVPEFSHEVKKPYKVQRPIEAQDFGYSAPSEQTSYDGVGPMHLHGGYANGHGV